MKKSVIGILAVVIGSLGYVAYKFATKETKNTKAIQLIPSDAIFFLETTHPLKKWEEFSESSFWNFLKTHPTFADISKDAQYLDSLADNNKQISKLLKRRKFFLSAHMTHSSDYDYLYLLDLKEASKLDLVPLVVKTLTNKNDYTVSEKEYKSTKILGLRENSTGEELYISQVDNFLALSYTKSLLLKCISNGEASEKIIPQNLTLVQEETKDNGLAKLYINYACIKPYIDMYANVSPTILDALSRSFSYSGLDLRLNENDASIEGFTSLPDSSELYSRLLQKYGNTEFEFDQVISARTAYLQALGINDFKEFFSEVLKLRSTEDESIAEYEAIKHKVEKVLGLTLEKDILPWIGSEVVISQNKPSKYHRNQEDILVAIKADNIDFAKEKLQKIQKSIKNRTPTKFKKLRFKTYDIYYLDIKGMFSLFFGKAFDKISKPYYTIVDEYILFSNNPKSLISALEDYENGTVLANSEDYQKVKNNLPEDAALFSYISGLQAYTALAQKINAQDKSEYAKSKPYIEYFKGIGFTYEATDDGFKNVLYMHFDKETDDELPTIDVDELAEDYLEDFSVTLKNMNQTEMFVLNEIENGEMLKYFPNSEVLQLRAKTKKGKLHGEYMEFYKDGTTRCKGKYRKGRKVGRWTYYTEEGTVSEKNWEGF